MKLWIATASLAFAISGCASFDFGRIGEDATPPSSEESVVVLGVAPGDQTVAIFPGVVKDGVFQQNPWRSAAISGAPKDGFVVAKIAGGETLALLKTFRVDKDGKGIPFTLVGACGNARTMVFAVPKGKIVYVGTIKYEPRGKEVAVEYNQDFDTARGHIDQRYRGLAGRLERWNFELFPTTVPCTTSITVPIYLPGRR